MININIIIVFETNILNGKLYESKLFLGEIQHLNKNKIYKNPKVVKIVLLS